MLHITTPFGRRSLTAAQVRAQANADCCLRETTVQKWTVLRDITEARAQLGLSSPSLAVLDALASFLPETALQIGEGPGLVVFPSNRALGSRTRGMAESTIRRHLAALVEAGIVIRRDSPNGKRYCRRGAGGQVAQAYGFDLAPLVARASEFADLAETVRAAAMALRVVRERVTLLRRDCVKLIQALEAAEGAPGAAEPLRARYGAILGALPRVAARANLDATAEALAGLAADVGKLLLAHQEVANSSGNAGQDERHCQNSNPELFSYEPASKMGGKGSTSPGPVNGAPAARGEAGQGAATAHLPTRTTYPLGLVLDACPDIRSYARGGIGSWRDLIDTAGLVRSILGISPHAWGEAREVMGDDAAAVTLAAILQRAEHIKAPGGYLRALVDRQRRGEFSLGPVLQALSRGRLARRAAGG
ncbi:plasmid replication protein RepC [Methylorubrum sp. SL192]|uniref:plasmid replication protein RepC n=1 Tax=Methylorubrum sp. SL192 TaxID=2995167 RepID=UPI0022751B20|nr:plasmid replication protein RepC [Methylorubrum sp. SL192]MCJ2029521.1 replication initiation protein RepC [Methylobacterium sp. J-043]MCY1640635.1 plasmid replication protein RepC [Methylorubrum sp. SL192]